MWFLLVFNSTTFSKAIELFTLLFEFFHVHDANVHFSLLNFSFRFRAQFYSYVFFLTNKLHVVQLSIGIFIGKLYFGLQKGKRRFYPVTNNYLTSNAVFRLMGSRRCVKKQQYRLESSIKYEIL